MHGSLARTTARTAAVALFLGLVALAPASADEHVDLVIGADDVAVHLEALQAIADANGGNRAFDTPGYQASVDYVVGELADVGVEAVVSEFVVDDAPVQARPPTLERTAPTPRTYVHGTDYVQPEPGPPVSAESEIHRVADGCDPDAWLGLPDDAVALVALSVDCPAYIQHQEAYANDAGGVLFSPLDGPGAPPTEVDLGRQQLFFGLPTMSLSGDVAAELALLAETEAVTVLIDPGFTTGPVATTSVLAELPGRTDEVIVVGAHLDSVLEGPGINDNGSGVAGLLAIAEQLAVGGPTTERTIRFAWWGGEELGVLGSAAYVEALPPDELERIVAYLNVDMIGSPNFRRAVADPSVAYDPTEVAPGSADIAALFEAYFSGRGEPTVAMWWGGNSDDFAFGLAGIPTGGLNTGATEIKTEVEASLFGGTAGAPFDPCYHQACDDLANTDPAITAAMAQALGTVTLQLAVVVDESDVTASTLLPPATAPAAVPVRSTPNFTG